MGTIYFYSTCVFTLKMGHFQVTCIWLLQFYPICQSAFNWGIYSFLFVCFIFESHLVATPDVCSQAIPSSGVVGGGSFQIWGTMRCLGSNPGLLHVQYAVNILSYLSGILFTFNVDVYTVEYKFNILMFCLMPVFWFCFSLLSFIQYNQTCLRIL